MLMKINETHICLLVLVYIVANVQVVTSGHSGHRGKLTEDRQSLINFVEAVKLARLASSNLQQYTAVTLPLRRNVVRFFAAANLVLFTRRVIL